MDHSRNDQPVDVAKNFLKCFAFFGRLRWHFLSDRARLVIRRDAQVRNVFPKISNPISELMKLFPENSRLGVAGWLSLLHQNAKPKLKWNAPKSSPGARSGFHP